MDAYLLYYPPSRWYSMFNYAYRVPDHDILSKEEEKILFLEYISNPSTKKKNKIIGYYYKFAIQCGTVYTNKYKHVQVDDLVSYAMLGLLEAVDKYDPKTNAKFTTYAVWWIKASIHRNVEICESLVRHPATVHNKLQQAITKNAIDDEITQLFDAVQNRISLDVSPDDENGSLMESLSDPNSIEFENLITDEETRTLLMYHIDKVLEPREQKVIKDYFGLYGTNVSAKELASELKVSKELIRHIRNKALTKLKDAIKRNDFV